MITSYSLRTRAILGNIGLRTRQHSKVCTKTTKGQYSPVQLKQVRLISGLLNNTQTKHILILNSLACTKKNSQLMTIYVKTVLGQNPDLHMVRTNQDVHIYLGTTLPSNNTVVCKSSSTELVFTSQLEYSLFRLVMNCMY